MPYLRPASPAERPRRDQATFAAWGRGSTLPQYLAREEQLRSQAWSKNALTTWFYMDGDNRTILSSCETYEVDSWLGDQKGKTWEVASVFTEEPYRGRGYAGAMLQALLEHLRRRPAAQASVLFSDVGEQIYRRIGYSFVAPQLDYVFAAAALSSSELDSTNVQWLHSCPALICPQQPRTLSIAPTVQQLAWHREIERLATSSLPSPPPAPVGAQILGAEHGLAYWQRDPKDPQHLALLWLQASTPAVASRLIAAARHTALRSGLQEVHVWDSEGTGIDLATMPAASSQKRQGMIPMMAPLQPNIDAWHWVQRGLWV